MKSLQLTNEDRSEMKRFYLKQYDETLRKAKHLKKILDKLNDVDFIDLETDISGLSSHLSGNPIQDSIQSSNNNETYKRGRKSVWGNFILVILETQDKPMSYKSLIKEAISKYNLPESKTANVKQAISNSAFRLRVINKKVETFGFPGKKERFLCLNSWFENGALKAMYQEKLNN